MKQKDIALIVVIVAISAAVSFFASRALLVKPESRQQEAEVVQAIKTDFPKPDTRYFNKDAFDPAQSITIGQNANTNPFNSSN